MSPITIVALAIAWPVVVVLGIVAYALVPLLLESEVGTVAAIGFGFGAVPFSEAWPGYVILFLPPLALVSAWLYLRRRQRGASPA